ncbi:MAG: hypothetical protein A2320_02675 [Pseudomonadales bacterium GWC2_63_15]|nr:MAG: hypothetical protein A2320_02675 [Pseudomonadales bacterium GWC2_63_15]
MRSWDEHKDATANAGACSQEQPSRPNQNGVRLPRLGAPNLAMMMRSGYIINRAQVVPPPPKADRQGRRWRTARHEVLIGEPID